MRISRRLPLHTRPLPFLAGWTLLIVGIVYGFSWNWSTTLFSGNVLVQTRIPSQLIVFSGVKALWLVGALVGMAILVGFSFGSERAARRGGPMAPKWRFYPFVFLLGLFLVVFGSIYLFDVSFAADDTPGGFVIFTSLNYAGLTHRYVLGTIGLILASAGAFILVTGSLAFTSAVKPLPGRQPPTQAPASNEPVVATKRPKTTA